VSYVAYRGGVCDYYGITYDKIDQQRRFWPCPGPGRRDSSTAGLSIMPVAASRGTSERTSCGNPVLLTTDA
jgi:hypothetical protein